MMIVDDPAKDRVLRDSVEELAGATIAGVQRISGGAFRTSARIALERDGRPVEPVFLKIDLGSAPATPFNLKREYQVLHALDGQARAPRTLGWLEPAMAMAMTCIPGDANFAGIADPELRARVEADFIAALVECHGVDVARLGLDHLPPGLSAQQAIDRDLALWEGLLESRVRNPDPLILFAFAWMGQHRLRESRPAVLVQGDAGPGNFLFDATGVTGVVDWEMCHLGHPLEDLACILVRSLVQPMADTGRLISLYEQATGRPVDMDDLLYCTILVMTRFSVPISMALESRHTGLDFGLMHGYFRSSLVSLARLIARADRIELDETTPEAGSSPDVSFEIDYLRAVLRDLVRPAVDDPYLAYRLDGAIGLTGYLSDVLGQQGPPPGVDQTGMRAAFGDLLRDRQAAQTLQTLLHEALWREKLMTEMLGPMYGRRVSI